MKSTGKPRFLFQNSYNKQAKKSAPMNSVGVEQPEPHVMVCSTCFITYYVRAHSLPRSVISNPLENCSALFKLAVHVLAQCPHYQLQQNIFTGNGHVLSHETKENTAPQMPNNVRVDKDIFDDINMQCEPIEISLPDPNIPLPDLNRLNIGSVLN